MLSRITDPNIRDASKRDFVQRKRVPKIWQLVAIFFIFYTTIIFATETMAQIDSRSVYYTILAIIVGGLTWFTVFFEQRSRDLVLATEFQNALFASATGLNTKFCLITKKDGTIVYFDPGFQRMFPDFLKMEQRAIDLLLEIGGATREDSQKVLSALDKGVFDKVIFSLKTSEGVRAKIILTIDPLPRPSGFFLFRAREYVEQRAAPAARQEALPSGEVSPTLTAAMLHNLNDGIYATDAEGNIQFANKVLEDWLGYDQNEILSRQLSIQDVIYQMEEKMGNRIQLSSYSGEVQLQKKNGSLIRCWLDQEVLLSPSGQTLGCTAVIKLFEQPLKKKHLTDHF